MPFAFPPTASAQTPPQTENRFLFIINTSSAMRRMTNGIQEAVLGLLKSDMQGQMRDGDTFGIWTYDDQLHTGFPMQVWSKQNQSAVLQAVSDCLAEPRYQNKPHLEKALPAALQLIAHSRVITLILIFDGSETMQGTGFDQDINDLHKEFAPQLQADGIPFVTVLAAREGKVFDYRVRTPSSVSLPQTADFFKPPVTNTLPAVAAATNPPPAAVAPPPPEPRHLDIVLKPTPVPKTNPPPAAPPVEPPNSQTPNPNPQSAPAATRAEAPLLHPLNPNLNPNPNPNPALPARADEPPKPEPPPNRTAPIASPAAASPPQSETTAVPTNPQSALSSVALAEEEIRPPSPGLRRAGNPQSSPPQSAAPLAAPAAVALPPPSDHLALLVIALSLVTIAVVLAFFLILRPRAAPSLISQSMDRPQ